MFIYYVCFYYRCDKLKKQVDIANEKNKELLEEIGMHKKDKEAQAEKLTNFQKRYQPYMGTVCMYVCMYVCNV